MQALAGDAAETLNTLASTELIPSAKDEKDLRRVRIREQIPEILQAKEEEREAKIEEKYNRWFGDKPKEPPPPELTGPLPKDLYDRLDLNESYIVTMMEALGASRYKARVEAMKQQRTFETELNALLELMNILTSAARQICASKNFEEFLLDILRPLTSELNRAAGRKEVNAIKISTFDKLISTKTADNTMSSLEVGARATRVSFPLACAVCTAVHYSRPAETPPAFG
jgi:hypothetical protein